MIRAGDIEVIFPEDVLMARVDDLAARLTPRLSEGAWTLVTILIGAAPFTTDLMKALARRGLHPLMDALWLESYHDARESSGRVGVRADLSRDISGRRVVLIDDVFDTGRTLDFARRHVMAKGALEVVTVALVRKPAAPRGEGGVDYYGFDAPGRFLVGYGMDDAGLYRGLPFIGAAD